MSAPVKNASPVSSKHAARGSLAPGSVFALAFALFGVGVAEMYCDGFAYEVLIHRVFPIPGRSFPIPAAVAAHLAEEAPLHGGAREHVASVVHDRHPSVE